jgi:hypothetical protein
MPYGVIGVAWRLFGHAHSDPAKGCHDGFEGVVKKVRPLRLEQDCGRIGRAKSKTTPDNASPDYDWQQLGVSSLPGGHQEPAESGARADSKSIGQQIQANHSELGMGVSAAIVENPRRTSRAGFRSPVNLARPYPCIRSSHLSSVPFQPAGPASRSDFDGSGT